MAAPGTDIAFSESRTDGYRKFANKIWNAARFMFMNLDAAEQAGVWKRAELPSDLGGFKPGTLEDRWILSRFQRVTKDVNDALETFRFHEAANRIYDFFWGDFCDWYIEWVKPELHSADRERATVAWKNLFAAFDAALRLLHPFMPFLTEELWHQLPQKAGAKSIALGQFPEAHGHWKNKKTLCEVEAIQEVVTALRNIRAELKLDPKKKVTADFSTVDAGIGELVQANRTAVERFALLTELRVVPRTQFDTKSAAVRSTAKFDVRIAYSDTVDATTEKTRLKKEIEGLEKAIESKERQLRDETFRSRAPEKIIKGLEATLAEQRIELRKLKDRLSQLEKDS